MIDLYTFTTPNGRKISIALEELGLPYTAHSIHIGKGEQHTPEYLKINPNGKIPAIIDRDTGTRVFESGAILIYLAEKTGRLLPREGAERYAVLEWLMFQMGGVGPMFGQLGHFLRAAPEPIPYAIERYRKEALRLCAVLDSRLATAPYLAGAYSIADIATYPWVAGMKAAVSMDEFTHINRWLDEIGARPAVQRGMVVPG